MGEEKRKKMHGEEVTLKDMILKNIELKSKIFDLEEKYKELEGRITTIENTPPPFELARIGGG